MRITRLLAYPLRNPDPGREAIALVIVEIETDEGLTGLGSVGGFPVGAETIITRQFAPLLEGADPTDIETLWERLYASLNRQGQRGTGVMALSGVDLALWDLLGKSVGRPVVSLIGGGSSSEPCPFISVRYRCVDARTTQSLLDEVLEGRRHGFNAFKYFTIHGPARRREGPADRDGRAARNPLGHRPQCGPDGGCPLWLGPSLRPAHASAAGRRWAPAGWKTRFLSRTWRATIRWPAPARCRWRPASPNAPASPFISLINAGVHYLQPDVNRVGGLTETLRICALAASHQRPVAPHQGWLHSWHLIAARANCPIGEYFPRRDPLPGNSLIWDALKGEPEAIQGAVTIPDRPGFGWTLDQDSLTRYAPD